MTHGPVDMLLVRFPDNNFSGEIAAELKALVDANIVRILDLMFVTKSADGELDIVELTDLDDIVASVFNEFVGDVEEFFSDEDVLVLASGLEPNSSAGLILYENVWAMNFAQAIRNANGEVLISERIPRVVIEDLELLEEIEELEVLEELEEEIEELEVLEELEEELEA